MQVLVLHGVSFSDLIIDVLELRCWDSLLEVVGITVVGFTPVLLVVRLAKSALVLGIDS